MASLFLSFCLLLRRACFTCSPFLVLLCFSCLPHYSCSLPCVRLFSPSVPYSTSTLTTLGFFSFRSLSSSSPPSPLPIPHLTPSFSLLRPDPALSSSSPVLQNGVSSIGWRVFGKQCAGIRPATCTGLLDDVTAFLIF